MNNTLRKCLESCVTIRSLVSKGELLPNILKKRCPGLHKIKNSTSITNLIFIKAEKWLEEQAKALGWSKAMKMESRSTLQGLIGIAWDKQYAAMVEVNCETDFVGRNEKFQKLVDLVAKTCLQYTQKESPSTKTLAKVSFMYMFKFLTQTKS